MSSDNDDSVLRRYQEEVSAPIVASFLPETFNPIPWFSNCHVQTIAANQLRHVPECNYYTGGIVNVIGGIISSPKLLDFFWDKRERIDTPDGDWFHVDYKFSGENSKGMVVLLHGLESNSDSKLSRDMTNAYQQQGFDVACLNFRGCSGEANGLLGGYHLGFTQDVLHFLDVLKSRSGIDIPPLYLSGFSLGANVVLKALGELGMKAPEDYNIFGAAAFCVPFDAERNAPFLGRPGFNQVVYCENLLRTLRTRAQLQLGLYCNGDESTDKFDYKGVMEAKTITDFDEAFVAPIYGFDSARDYYRKTSSIHFMDTIAVPTLILNSRDDPFMDPDHFPVELTQEGGGQAPIKMVVTKNGGHLGYLFHQVESSDAILETSWSSTELARFFQHVHHQHETNQ
jgi:predicted alpha/beta-fold hydrolase